MIPIQVDHDIPLQVFGDEKSADRLNLIDRKTGELSPTNGPKAFA